MSFSATKLAGHQYLVEGTDFRGVSGSTVIPGHEWDDFQESQQVDSKEEAFDQAVEEFFAPLIKAVDDLTEAHKPQLDPLLHVVTQEAVEGTEAKARQVTYLGLHAGILRAIHTGQTDRLIWINDELHLTAPDQGGDKSQDVAGNI